MDWRTWVVENLDTGLFARKVWVRQHVDPRHDVFLVSLVRINTRFPQRCPRQEQPQDRHSAQRPHFVPWVVSKALEPGEGLLLRFEWR